MHLSTRRFSVRAWSRAASRSDIARAPVADHVGRRVLRLRKMRWSGRWWAVYVLLQARLPEGVEGSGGQLAASRRGLLEVSRSRLVDVPEASRTLRKVRDPSGSSLHAHLVAAKFQLVCRHRLGQSVCDHGLRPYVLEAHFSTGHALPCKVVDHVDVL